MEEKARGLKYYHGKESVPVDKIDISTEQDNSNRSGRQKLMDSEEEYFMILVRLRRGFCVFEIARMFGISAGHFSKVFNTWINFLRDELTAITMFPSQEHVQRTLKARVI